MNGYHTHTEHEPHHHMLLSVQEHIQSIQLNFFFFYKIKVRYSKCAREEKKKTHTHTNSTFGFTQSLWTSRVWHKVNF